MIPGMLRRLCYSLLGLALLPAAVGLALTLYHLLVEIQMDPAAGATLLRALLGVAVWLLLFFLLPRPIRSYVLAHELSHALAAWLSGERAGKLRVHRHGGSVEVSRTTLLIALAPYMFPFYSLLLLGVTALAGLWLDLTLWMPWVPFFIGLTWAHHLSFTVLSLALGQSDLQHHGPLCAYPVIFIANILCLLPFLIHLAPLSLEAGIRLILTDQHHAHLWVWNTARHILLGVSRSS